MDMHVQEGTVTNAATITPGATRGHKKVTRFLTPLGTAKVISQAKQGCQKNAGTMTWASHTTLNAAVSKMFNPVITSMVRLVGQRGMGPCKIKAVRMHRWTQKP
tara:strand:+ start:1367 stop:1678 length:312 start_codon:yes stop_codon:yes gene_type:complete